MVDYSSWKVADLKAELKKREIPQTGLRVKQQFIDKLNELDSQTGQTEPEAAAIDESAVPQQPSPDVVSQAPDPEPEQSKSEEPSEEPTLPQEEPLAPESESAAEKGENEKDQKDEPAQNHPETVSNEKIEHDTNPVEESAIVDQTAPKQQSPTIEESPAIVTDQDSKTENSAKPQETPAPSSLQTPEETTATSTPLPTEEALEDTRKRKRRSQSPAPTLEEIANRKARAEEAAPRVLMKDQGNNDQKPTATPAESQNDSLPADKKILSPKPAGKQDARFRNLFAPSGEPARPPSPQDMAMPDVDAGPALHAATSALYIDGLMRPLQPATLRKHLSNLAATPNDTSDSDTIVEFYLDSIKTHCFVSFTSTVAASRVRSALHGTVWPNERNRKSLRADFIPDDKTKEWIHIEEQSRDRAGPAPRWEVRYETSDDGTTALHAAVGSAPPGRRASGFNRTPPLGPRSDIERLNHRPSIPAPPPAPRPGQGFKPLDEIFESTTAKPKLYYLPVPRPVADKRLDQFDDLIQKGVFPRRGGDEMRRITFENEDQFVDVGPERMGPGPRFGGRGRGRGRRGDWH
ncbi:unnamed protein product [Penicillium salamii]|nr:unnamed protein product [Penicillium salamii]